MQGEARLSPLAGPTITRSLRLEDFWARFHLFASPFEDFCFRYWYLIFLVYCAVLGLLDLALDLHNGINLAFVFSYNTDHYYLFNHFMFSFLKSDVTNAQLISEGVGLVLVAIFFRLWCRQIAPLFQYFYDMGRICSANSVDKVDQQGYVAFLEEYQQTLVSWKRYVLLGLILLVMIIFMLLIILPRIGSQVAQQGSDPVRVILWLIRWPCLLIILFGTTLAYYIAMGCWTMAVTGLYIRKLTTEFVLIVQPQHPDNCGGLRQLGNFCLGMALPILVAALFLSTYGIWFALTGNSGFFLVVTSNVFLFLVALPLAAIAFFVPLWSIHRRMVEQKQEGEEHFSGRITELEKRIYTLLDEKKLEEAKTAKEELEMVQSIQSKDATYPLWPFDQRLFLTYLIPHILPLLSLIISFNANGPVASVLKAILNAL